MKLNNYSIYIIIFIAGFAAGFYFFIYFLDFGYFLSKEVSIQFDPLNLVTLFVTILLAIYVARELNKKNEQERVEKDLIIDDIKNFKTNLVSDVKKIIDSEKTNYIQVVSKLKTQRMHLNSILKLIRDYNLLENEDLLNKLDDKIRDIRDLLTETPVVAAVNQAPEIIIVNGEITLGSIQREKIDTALNEMGNLIFVLVFEVNKY